MGQKTVEFLLSRPWWATLAATAVLVGLLAGSGVTGSAAAGDDATVARVIDGDTIEVLDRMGVASLVRYVGVDSPELRRRSRDGRWVYHPQPYAEAAWALNRRLVEGKRVRLEYDRERRDRYGRLLAYVYVDGRFINAELVESGLARVVLYPPNTRLAGLLLRLQREARTHRLGIWAHRRSTAADRQ